jgi:hypothetical protein
VTWELLQIEHNIPATRTVKTAGGGLHCYFLLPEGVKLRQSVTNGLGPGVDIKSGAGGYVVAPGSTIDGEYTWLDRTPSVPAPAWMPEEIGKARERDKDAGKRIADEDESTIEQIETWIDRQKPESVPHGIIDDTAYKVAARFGDYGAGYETRLHYLAVWSEKCCMPPMAQEDLERVAGSAGSSRLTAIGSKHVDVRARGV